MGFIDNIKLGIKEYKRYKEPSNSRELLASNSVKRNIFTYIQAKRFMEKHANSMYKHFGIMKNVIHYEFLMNFFGKKKLEGILNTPNLTTAEMGDMLFEESLPEKNPKDIILDSMRDSIIFNRATGLELSKLSNVLRHNLKYKFKREALEDKNILDIFEDEQLTEDTLKEIYDIYGEEIVSQYKEDSFLRNATVLEEKDGVVTGVQDHITEYSEEDFHKIFEKHFNNEELSEKELYILVGLLTKEADLIGEYSVKYLKSNPDYIKSEIDLGIFKDIVVANKKYTNSQRKTMVALHGLWKEDDLERYNNLGLLKQRAATLSNKEKSAEVIAKIDEILEKPLEKVAEQGEEIAEFMRDAFLDYEIENREQLIEKVYNPENSQEIIIDDLSKIGSPAMLHFFDSNRKMSNFNDYIKKEEQKRSDIFGVEFKFSEQERENQRKQYEIKENHYITDNALDFEGIGQVDSWKQYRTNTSNQLCALLATPEEILNNIGLRGGKLALGFSKKTLDSELIATISSVNIHSNKGLDYVETNNSFEDFSASYEDLLKRESEKENSEIVLFRNTDSSSLKPSYVMYIANNRLDSAEEVGEIETIRKQMQDAKLNVPLVIFDRATILEKMKLEEKNNLNQEEMDR